MLVLKDVLQLYHLFLEERVQCKCEKWIVKYDGKSRTIFFLKLPVQSRWELSPLQGWHRGDKWQQKWATVSLLKGYPSSSNQNIVHSIPIHWWAEQMSLAKRGHSNQQPSRWAVQWYRRWSIPGVSFGSEQLLCNFQPASESFLHAQACRRRSRGGLSGRPVKRGNWEGNHSVTAAISGSLQQQRVAQLMVLTAAGVRSIRFALYLRKEYS